MEVKPSASGVLDTQEREVIDEVKDSDDMMNSEHSIGRQIPDLARGETREMLPRQFVRSRELFSIGDQMKESQNDMSDGEVLSGRLGIVVLSPSLQILHLNRQAQILISDMVSTTPETPQPNHRSDVLPQALVNLSHEILSVLRSRHERSEKGQWVIQHSAHQSSGKPVSIRGVGVLNGQGIEQARIVLLLTGTSADYSDSYQIV